jgi:2-C-methyl-D-erythritol 4-phosphate cytidylyltransferase
MDLVLLAGGSGDRSGLSYPKPLFPIHGKPVIRILIDLFRGMPEINQIIVPCDQEVAEHCADCVIVPPGRTRQESVYNGLQKVTTDRVVIHEAVRPFIAEEFARKVMDTEGDCVVPVVGVKPTIYNTNYDRECYEDRDDLREVQLPQMFDTRKLLIAHRSVEGNYFTDDSSLYCYYYDDYPALVDGLDCNLKLTTPTDFAIAEVLYDYCHGRF